MKVVCLIQPLFLLCGGASALRGTTERDLKAVQVVEFNTMLNDFKSKNLLKDDYEIQPVQASNTEIVISSGAASSSRSSSLAISLDNDALEPIKTFVPTATYIIDGKTQNGLPSPSIFASKVDPDVWVAKLDNGKLQFAVEHGNKTSSYYLPMDPQHRLFVKVGPDDVDPDKLSQLKLGSPDDDHYDGHRSLLRRNRLLKKDEKATTNTPCTSFRTIEVAIVYESRFCQAFGGNPAQANQVVEMTIAETSRMFQQPGICAKVVLSHLEGYCDKKTDPYRAMFDGNVCDYGDGSLLRQFGDYWTKNRPHVPRDVTHLFHGYPFRTNTIGCAYGQSLCSNKWGYGVNEITRGGNSLPFWSQLFAHELGHSAGAFHECCNGYIMDTVMTGYASRFSPTSVSQIKRYMDQTECLQSSPFDQGAAPRPAPIVPVPAPTKAPTPPNQDEKQCREHLEFCTEDGCCPGITCYLGYVCLMI